MPAAADEAFRLLDRDPNGTGTHLEVPIAVDAPHWRAQFRLDAPAPASGPRLVEGADCDVCVTPETCNPFRVCWREDTRLLLRFDPAFRILEQSPIAAMMLVARWRARANTPGSRDGFRLD